MDYEQLVEQIDQYHERLTQLAEQRQDYGQSISRFVRWFNEQRHLFSIDPSSPLKINDLERLLKKSQARVNFNIIDRLSIISFHWTNRSNKDSLSKVCRIVIVILNFSRLHCKKKGIIRNAYGFRHRSNTVERFTNEDETFFPFIGLGVFGRTGQKPLNGV
jgi:hypothetical protein